MFWYSLTRPSLLIGKYASPKDFPSVSIWVAHPFVMNLSQPQRAGPLKLRRPQSVVLRVVGLLPKMVLKGRHWLYRGAGEVGRPSQAGLLLDCISRLSWGNGATLQRAQSSYLQPVWGS
ncbi:hypothetical protein BaRGS_00025537 [Batillaria attramentaria]|uniref:Uncharacterized protein n=1 Tax=Batillaria attramentaria TaxID=370345 RepID=A0ABD0K854_9CAEN